MQCDVLIVGAGPAGSCLARQLAQSGFDVLLVDKKAFPRHKPCGEFLSPECQPYLVRLGLGDVLHQLGAHLVEGMLVHDGERQAAGRFRPVAGRGDWVRRGYGVRRELFDHTLLLAAQQAGARVSTACEFVELRRDGDRIVGATLRSRTHGDQPCRARWVIGADGVHSKVARALGVQRRLAWLEQFALVTHFEGVPALPTAEVHLLRGGFFAATTVDQGRFGVNLVLPKNRMRKDAGCDWDEFVGRHLDDAPRLQQRLAGAQRVLGWRGIGPFAHRTTTSFVPGAALVGDAAGYVDPLTGEGIYFALFGARALGTALAEALQDPEHAERAMRAYAAARRREIGPRLVASKLLQRGLRHPWIVGTFVRALARWPRLADVLVTMSGDTIHPRDLWRPSFWRDFRSTA